MRDNGLRVVNYFVVDPTVASARRVEAVQFPDQLLAESLWVFSNRPHQRAERRFTNFDSEAVEA